MADKLHHKVTYYANLAIEAFFIGKAASLRKYVHLLEQTRTARPLQHGYRQYVLGLTSNDNECSLDLLGKAHESFLEAGAIQAAAVALLDIGRLREAGQQALTAAREAHEMFKRTGDMIGQSKALSNMGVNYMHIQEYDNACASLLASIDIQRSTGDLVGLGIAALNLAACYLYVGDNCRALQFARESIMCLERDVQMSEAGSFPGGMFVWKTNGWQRIPASTEGFAANAYVNYGNALEVLGDHENAIDAFINARVLMCTIRNRPGEAMVLNQIGDVLREQSDFARAETYFRQSKDLFIETETRGYMYAVALQGIGEACAAQGKFSDAFEYYQAALQEFEYANHRAGEAEVQLLIGEALISQGRYEYAITQLKLGLAMAQSVSAMEIVVRSNRAIGSAMLHIDSAGAREYLLRALILAEEHSMKLEQQNIHRELSSYYKLVGEFIDALSHFERFYELQKQIFTEKADQRIRSFEILHKVERYEQLLSEMAIKVREVEFELEERTRQLASLAARIMEKQEFVRLVENGLTKIIKAHSDSKDLLARELLDSIQTVGDVRSDWEELTKKFLSVHREFAERLVSVAPKITPMELQVCVLLRLSMGAKQIADVLDIEPKTVFNHQQRIRTKLCLNRSENLKTYLVMLDVAAATE